MPIDEKTKIGLIVFVLFISTFVIVNYRTKAMEVKIIYFRESSCIIIDNTDRIIEEIEHEFGDELEIRIIDLDNEESFSDDDKILIDKYQVIGVPEIIINGKEYTKEFTKERLENEICKRFLIKPEACK